MGILILILRKTSFFYNLVSNKLTNYEKFIINSWTFSCGFLHNNSSRPSVTEEQKAKFEQQIDAFKTFTTGFYNEDIDQLMSVVADSVQWSPPQYNGGVLLGYDDFKAAGLYYFENFDEINLILVKD